MARDTTIVSRRPATLTLAQMEQGIVRLERRIVDLQSYDVSAVDQWAPNDLKALEISIEQTLDRVFGADTSEYHRFKSAATLAYSEGLSFIVIGGEDVPPTPMSEVRRSIHSNIQRSIALLRQAVSGLREDADDGKASPIGQFVSSSKTKVFIGHGQSPAWRDLKDFVSERLNLSYDEFNRVPVAGLPNVTRLANMLDDAAIALIILTAEDEQANGELHARQNVIHEVGLFQGRLGFSKAIVLLEEGCEQFSNIEGLGQIRFPKGNISAKFEDVRRVLEREGLL
jgi:hypothetical protein